MWTILLVDNSPDFVDSICEYLEPDYRVIRAYTVDEARRLLAERHIHLAIVDVRLVNDDDERDTSGLTLARDPAYRHLPKIILTGWPSYEGVREVMAPAPEGLPPAINYVSKRTELSEGLLQAIEDAFAEHVPINRSLSIRWQRPGLLSFAQIATLLEPDLGPAHLPERLLELEDLWRTLFCEEAAITICELLWCREGRACLTVWAHRREGASELFSATVGLREPAQRELALYRQQAPGGGASLSRPPRESMHFAAAAYALPGAGPDAV